MPERDDDPIASTQMFRAFVQRGEPEPEPITRRVRPATIAVTLTLVAVAIALSIWLIVR
jgi:hypothetical protein